MDVRFVLGPSGSGKTYRCLEEIREALLEEPTGPPLLLVAPKQSTFQLERQLLADPALPGWSRLQILSFDRLARMVMSEAGPTELLDEEGRIMVLRGLLRWHHSKLRVFGASARMAGFAREASTLLRELRRWRVGPERLEQAAGRLEGNGGSLSDKLRDLACLARAYGDWLAEHGLRDADLLLELAADRLQEGKVFAKLGGVWVDGFAEMTPAEVELLVAVVQRARRSTLAFCLDAGLEDDPSWLSIWAVVGHTARKVRSRLEAVRDARCEVTLLSRGGEGRFSENPTLAHLESSWVRPTPASGLAATGARETLRLVACSDFEREAEVAAREVWRHVRKGGRFREVSVILRSLEGQDATLRRVFLRYGIPFFLDRRESLAHHPLAELTRCAIRLACGIPRSEDWFGALKTGLVCRDLGRVDRWENESLAAGTAPEAWLGKTGPDENGEGRWSSSREMARYAREFDRLTRKLGSDPDGPELATALREFWEALEVRQRLEAWAEEDARLGGQLELQARVHGAAWEQMEAWLEALALGFGGTRLPATEWLGIVEAGLANLSAGVIPPSQDQVMIGAIDRSRQPEIRLALVLGLNEGVFPAVPAEGGLLSEGERDRLARTGLDFEFDRRRRIGHERFLGYVALTRSRGRLVLCWSERDDSGRAAAASSLVTRVRLLFPGVPIEAAADEGVGPELAIDRVIRRTEHRSELLPWLAAREEESRLDALCGSDSWLSGLREWRRSEERGCLSSAAVEALYGRAPEVSVTALESLAACPFRFFATRGLEGRQRKRFEVDRRQAGSLVHELLARFHRGLVEEGLRWRDLDRTVAASRLRCLGEECVRGFGSGLFDGTPEGRWEAAGCVEATADLVGDMVEWMATYQFDPVLAEVGFGSETSITPWCLDLGKSRTLRIEGKIDRVDVYRGERDQPWYLVVDYKLRGRRLDERLALSGVDMQLVAYALAIRAAIQGGEFMALEGAVPAGFCYVGLAGGSVRPAGREGLEAPAEVSRTIHRHRGKLLADAVAALDSAQPSASSGQFALRFKKDGSLSKVGDGCTRNEFDGLLAEVSATVRRLGEALFEGDARVMPFRLGARTACDRCDLRPVCRFDPWLHAYRELG